MTHHTTANTETRGATAARHVDATRVPAPLAAEERKSPRRIDAGIACFALIIGSIAHGRVGWYDLFRLFVFLAHGIDSSQITNGAAWASP